MTSAVNRSFWLGLRFVLKSLLAPVFALGGFRVIGRQSLPRRRRPLILAANHAAFIDSVYLIVALGPRFTICGAKPRLFRTPFRRALMALANILRVDDHDRYLADCRQLLETGEMLLIYPEMGRFPDGLGPFQTWAAEVALENGTAILPCYLFGTTRGQTGAVRLIVGQEIEASGSAEDLTRRLREAIEALAPGGTGGENAP